MKLRSFLTGLCAAAPLLFLPKFEPVKWKRTRQLWVPNPEYATATHEIEWRGFYGKWNFFDPDPARFVLSDGLWRHVPPYIEA